MRGDVSIINGKLCYEFEITDQLLQQHLKLGNKICRPDGSEWIIHQMNLSTHTVWCYKTDADSYSKLFDSMSKDLDEIRRKLNLITRQSELMKEEINSHRKIIKDSSDPFEVIDMHEYMYHASILARIHRYLKKLYYAHIKYRHVSKAVVVGKVK
jgi:hypothetical protein